VASTLLKTRRIIIKPSGLIISPVAPAITGVALDKRDALLIADDVGNTVWRVTASSPAAAAR